MRINAGKVTRLCRKKGLNLGRLLEEARVSRNAYYSLARRESVLPRSILAIADRLDVAPSELLQDDFPALRKARSVLAQVDAIADRHPEVDRDNIRHVLLLLQEKPIDRLRRALLRARKPDLYR
jgi:transcriptional regulator with XRE-family HTH domain